MLTIEKGVPAPPRRDYSYDIGNTYKAMEVGDSAFFPSQFFKRSNLTSLAYYYKKHHGMKFTRRTVRGGYRVWRVE